MDKLIGKQFKLFRKDGQVFFYTDELGRDEPVRILLAAPLTEGSQVVSIMHATDKQELALLFSLEDLDEGSQRIIAEELRRRYFLPKIKKINDINIYLGEYYWDVMTDRGEKKFTLNSPVINIRWLTNTRLLLNAADGLHYELPDILKLDHESRKKIENIL